MKRKTEESIEYSSSSVSTCSRSSSLVLKPVPVIATSFLGLDTRNVRVTEEVATKEDDGDYKSNHTVLLYFVLIILLVLFFSFYFFLPSFFDTFLYCITMYIFRNRIIIRNSITSGALANFHSSIPAADLFRLKMLKTTSTGKVLANLHLPFIFPILSQK